MPVYTYRCQSCGVQFDKFQKFSEKPLTRCPECRKGQVRRVPQPSAVVFKGSGWYATDHRSASGQASKKSESDSGSADKSEKADSKAGKKEDKPAKAGD
ncbi:MAG: FmdB family zinc ribbon protein [Anaerolineales bacterium]